MDDYPVIPPSQVPLPRPDPRGPPTYIGALPQPMEPAARQYGISDHMLAVLRAMFEGTKYREKVASERAINPLYDK